MTLIEYLPIVDGLRRRGKASAADALARLREIGSRAEIIDAAVRAYATGGAQVVAVPYDEVVATVGRIDAFVERYYGDLDYDPELFVVLRSIAQALFDLQTLRLAFASQALLTSAQSNAFVPGAAPLSPYRLRQGDTLERIALETLRDVGRAQDIIDLNDLTYPYLDTARDYLQGEFTEQFDPLGYRVRTSVDRAGVPEGVRVTGEVIYLPSDAMIPSTAQLTDRDVELWGRDFAVGPDGYLVVDADGEIQTVAGKGNIEQALTQALRVTRGELVLDPDYGIERLLAVGIEGTYANTIFSGLEVARTVGRDPRVTRVRDIVTTLYGTTNRASMTVGLIGANQATIPLNLVLPESVVVG